MIYGSIICTDSLHIRGSLQWWKKKSKKVENPIQYHLCLSSYMPSRSLITSKLCWKKWNIRLCSTIIVHDLAKLIVEKKSCKMLTYINDYMSHKKIKKKIELDGPFIVAIWLFLFDKLDETSKFPHVPYHISYSQNC